MRFHSIVFNLQRYALKDDVIPLQDPIVTATGETIDAIPVKAGQWVTISFCGYHRFVTITHTQSLCCTHTRGQFDLGLGGRCRSLEP